MERTGREDNLPNIIPPSQSTSRGRSSSTLNRLEQTARQVQAFVETQRHENVPQTNVGVAAKLASNFNDARKTVGVDKKKKKAKGRPTDVVQLKITCLSTPHTTQVNRLDIGRLKRMGLGYPDDEITPSKRVPSRLPTTMTPQEFGEFLKISFPPLRNAGYDLAYAAQNTLFPFQEEINTPALIKQYLIKASRSLSIFVRPRVDLSSVCIQLREKRKADLVEEPADGFKIKIRTSNNWQLQCRRFKSTTRMQILQMYIFGKPFEKFEKI